MPNTFFNLQIGQKANKSYQKDMENLKEARETHANALNIQGDDQESKYISSILGPKPHDCALKYLT